MMREEAFFNRVVYGGIAYKIGENEPYTGKFICKYANEEIKEEEEYIAGIKEGKALKYYPQGQLRESSEFVNGQLNGDFLLFYSNGQLEEFKHHILF